MGNGQELLPGDLILVKSTGKFFALARRVVASPYDHVAVVLGGGDTLNIDKPSARRLPSSRLLSGALEPLVLRPGFADPQERDRFVRWLERLESRRYNVRRTLRLLGSLLLERLVGWGPPLAPPEPDADCWICTDAVLLGLETCAGRFRVIRTLGLHWSRLRCGTTNDLLRIAELRPDLLRPVTLAPAPASVRT